MDLSVYAPTVSVEGEIIAEPMRTTVTRTFYSRVALKLTPFVVVGWWLTHAGFALMLNIVIIFAILIVAAILFPPLGTLLSLGTGAFKGAGGLVAGISDALDGVIGPNKGQVPVLLVHVQSSGDNAPSMIDSQQQCPNVNCGHLGKTASLHCLACGTTLPDVTIPAPTGPRRHLVRIQGQIVGGEPRVGHQVSLKAFDRRGTLLFVSGIDRTTGAEIMVKRNADLGKQH